MICHVVQSIYSNSSTAHHLSSPLQTVKPWMHFTFRSFYITNITHYYIRKKQGLHNANRPEGHCRWERKKREKKRNKGKKLLAKSSSFKEGGNNGTALISQQAPKTQGTINRPHTTFSKNRLQNHRDRQKRVTKHPSVLLFPQLAGDQED